MEDPELDFCRECGMEFPDGPEEECPLCGNVLGLEESDDSADVVYIEFEPEELENPMPLLFNELDESMRCAVCARLNAYSDETFWNYWVNFDAPDWLSIDRVWCRECILQRFTKEHPEFGNSRLEPDTFLIWQEALSAGIDLGPKLSEIESSNAIRQLWSCSREVIVAWLASDCPIREVAAWASLFDEVDDAMAWRDAGFKWYQPEEWLLWDCTPAEAAEARDSSDEECCPDVGFKMFGFGQKDAVYLESHGFRPSKSDSADCFIGNWLPSGLSLSKIVELRAHLNEREDVFNALHDVSQSRLEQAEQTDVFWDALPRQFEELKATGLPITAINLEKYWGLNSKEILKVIDAGGTPGVAANIIRFGGSVSKIGIVERLLDFGLGQRPSSLIAQRGFLTKHLKQIENTNDPLSALLRLFKILDSEADLKAEEALGWLEVESTVGQAKPWRLHGFGPDDAAKWAREGFQPEMARQWKESGVTSPIVAKRRQDAGLAP